MASIKSAHNARPAAAAAAGGVFPSVWRVLLLRCTGAGVGLSRRSVQTAVCNLSQRRLQTRMEQNTTKDIEKQVTFEQVNGEIYIPSLQS